MGSSRNLHLLHKLAASATALGALLATTYVVASPAAFTFVSPNPGWVPVTLNGVGMSDPADDTSEPRDIVGDAANPMLFVAGDATHIYFRLRLDNDPRMNADPLDFQPKGWGCFINTDSNLQTYEFGSIVNGNDNPDVISFFKNSVTTIMNDPNDPPDLPALSVVQTPLAPGVLHAQVTVAGSNFGATPDFFLDWAVDRTAAEAGGYILGQPASFYCGSSNNGTNIDADCSGGSAGDCPLDSQFSDPVTCDDDSCGVCGDGTVNGNEGCDDGGTTAGDGCNAVCLKEIGEPCTADGVCASDFCDPANNTCACDDSADCASGEVCNTLPDPNVCVGSCPGLGTPCTAGVGACQASGSIVCLVVGVPVCDAVPGTGGPETCNNIDDDCNGSTDEGNPQGGLSCNTGLLGECATGVSSCQPGGNLVCGNVITPGQNPETCNGLDDDCDGSPDDGFNVGATCQVGSGACIATGQVVCNAGAAICNAVPGNMTTETCNGIDDDCDGTPDDGFNVGGACTNGVGACQAAGQIVCMAGAAVCDAVPGSSTTETCNGVDDDCDGTPDDGFNLGASCTVGLGECAATGVRICSGGVAVCDAVPGTPVTELCTDVLDTDCDGFTSNGCACTSDTDCALCNEQYGICVTPCADDTDCPTGQICDEGGGSLCVPACDADTDCPIGQVCDETSGECVGCTADNECPTGEGCNLAGGNCLPICTTQTDCTGGDTCDGALGLCVPCPDDSVCTSPQTCSTETATCVDACTMEVDCPNGVCDESHGVCEGCVTTSDCPVGVCDTTTNDCVECTGDPDCLTGVCDEPANTCVECTDDMDCPPGEQCGPQNTCEPPCVDDDDCTTGVCDPVTETCVECVDDDDCPMGVCDETTNTCVECLDDVDCPTGVCDEPAQTCVECVDDVDCPTGVCDPVTDQCVECIDDIDCPTGVCDPVTDTCTPPGGCITDLNCPVGQICEEEVCTEGCRPGDDDNCPDGTTCIPTQNNSLVGTCEPDDVPGGVSPEGSGIFSCSAATGRAPSSDAELPTLFLAFAGVSAAVLRRRRRRG